VGRSLLLVSEHAEDLKFWGAIAADAGLDFEAQESEQAVSKALSKGLDDFLFVDGKRVFSDPALAQVVAKAACPSRVFVITDEPINRLTPFPILNVLGHHVFRRYEGPAFFLYSKLIRAAIEHDPSGLLRYFPEGSKSEQVVLRTASDRATTLRKLEAFLGGAAVNDKLAAMGVDAADELLMNAIFDAPYSQGEGYYRRDTPRGAQFDLSAREEVTFRMAVCEEFVGISVTDQFGSLKRELLLKHLFQDFRKEVYVIPETQRNSGLGLHRINQQALALLFVSKPGSRTEVMVFFSNAKSYREFRLGFSFFSIFTD
jgi:hypothetical protein